MTEYLTEQEQVELLKNWLKQNGLVIVTGVIIAAAIIFGWRYWQERQNNILGHAAQLYDEMLGSYTQNDTKNTTKIASSLFNNYPKTVYGEMAAFMLAKQAINQNNYKEAENKLGWMMENSKLSATREIARIRLARVFITENNPQKSISLLQKIDDKSFLGLINEVKGDAYYTMHDIKQARHAYKEALSNLPHAETDRPILQMKYDNLTTIKQAN